MNDCAANCPFCNSAIEFSIDLLDTIVLCPVCQEEICLSKNDIIDFSEAKRREEKFQQDKAEIEKRELLKLKQLKEKQERSRRLSKTLRPPTLQLHTFTKHPALRVPGIIIHVF